MQRLLDRVMGVVILPFFPLIVAIVHAMYRDMGRDWSFARAEAWRAWREEFWPA